jgi:hypothetical protein
MNQRSVSDVFRIDSPEILLKEVLEILDSISPAFDKASIRLVCETVGKLYSGQMPGYRACNTGYHDLQHANNTLLAMARLIHGAVIEGIDLSEGDIVSGLVAAILHDVGYIQEASDNKGTGAKHKATHEQRSKDFLSRHGREFGLSTRQITDGRAIIACTDMALDISAVSFSSENIELLGKMLGTADLLAQLGDPAYLEKLPALYKECQEAGTNEYRDELDIIQKAPAFYDIAEKRLQTTLDSTYRFMTSHFEHRWGQRRNIYQEIIDSQKDYLIKVLRIPDSDPRDHLKLWRMPNNFFEYRSIDQCLVP